jgi:hypothetical protein
MPATGFFSDQARALIVLMPILRPVKEPGPMHTANPSIASIPSPDEPQTVSIMVMRCFEWVRLFLVVNSALTTPLSTIAVLQLKVAVSTARIFIYWSIALFG